MRRRVGYTVVEVMIFIAVSALMFVSAVGAVSSRQQNVQFSQAVREFEVSILDIMNDVSTGYYPALSTIDCAIDAATGKPELRTVNRDGVGSNESCVYIGKAIHFAPSGSADDQSKYVVYNVIGKRYIGTSGSTPVRTIDDADPIASDSDRLFEELIIPYGVRITSVESTDNSPSGANKKFLTPVLSFLSSFHGSSVGSESGSTDAQYVDTAPIRPTVTASFSRVTKSAALNMIESMNTATPGNEGYVALNPNQGVVVCLSDGGSRRASLTIGGDGSSRTVLDIGNPRTECP